MGGMDRERFSNGKLVPEPEDTSASDAAGSVRPADVA